MRAVLTFFALALIFSPQGMSAFDCDSGFAKVSPLGIVSMEMGNRYEGGGKIPIVGYNRVSLSPWQNNRTAIEVTYPGSGNIRAPSFVYDAQIRDPHNQHVHTMMVIVPLFAQPNGVVDTAFTEAVTQQTVRAIGSLPLANIDAVKKVKIYGWDSKDDEMWRQKIPGFTSSAAAASEGEIMFFRAGLPSLVSGTAAFTMRHEFGHTLAHKFWGSVNPGPEYTDLALLDRVGVSTYGNTSWAEDFAEATTAYIGSDGGRLDPSLRAKFANRFRYLDALFATDPRNRQFAAYSYALALVGAGGIFANGAKVYLSEKDVVIDNGDKRLLLIDVGT